MPFSITVVGPSKWEHGRDQACKCEFRSLRQIMVVAARSMKEIAQGLGDWEEQNRGLSGPKAHPQGTVRGGDSASTAFLLLCVCLSGLPG